MTPTDEQRAATEAFQHNRLLKITAFAGAGKTTTLQLLAETSSERGLYLAFNRQIALHAQKRFKTVDCRTTHSLAWRAIQAKRDYSVEKMQGKMSPAALADLLKLEDFKISGNVTLTPIQHAHLLARTVARFCQSADDEVLPEHVPHYQRIEKLPPALLVSTRQYAAECAADLWDRMTHPEDPIALGHDGYLKLWALGKPRLPFDYVLLDEAQDTNPVILETLRAQDCRLVVVGDPWQMIYEFRNALNAMKALKGGANTYLTQSFRFGDALASEASKVLSTLGERKTLRGNTALTTEILPEDEGAPDCVLARTNASVMAETIAALAAGKSPYILGGTFELKRMLIDVTALKSGRAAMSPDLFGFKDWDTVTGFAGSEEGQDLTAFVKLVNEHGEDALTQAITNTAASPGQAQITIGTAHKAKGCEWNSVRLCRDFLTQPVLTRKSSADPEIRLFYVAMTRAKQALSVDPEMMAIFTGDRSSTDASSVSPPQTSASHVSTHAEAPKPEPKPDFMNTLFNKAARRRANE